MSRSNPTSDLVNPSTRWHEWAGKIGKVKYYDKETQENVEVDLPFMFLVLDQLNTVVGFDKRSNSGFWANEVRSTQTDPLTVRTRGGVAFEGLYDSDSLPKGAKYAKSVYIAFKDADGKLQLGNIKLSGASIGPWIDFTKANNVNKIAVAITGSVADRNGDVDFFKPVFTAVPQVDEETEAAAVELDRALQEYLTGYLKNRSSASAHEPRGSEDVEIRNMDETEATPENAGPLATEDPKPAPAAKSTDGPLDLNKLNF